MSDKRSKDSLERKVDIVQKRLAKFDINERVDAATKRLDKLNAIGDISKKFDLQRNAIDNLNRHKHIPDIPVMHPMPNIKPITNPIHETNKRLASIEIAFEGMQDIAVRAATIGNDLQEETAKLQEKAAVFLDKFETAAEQNNKSARVAIGLAILAVLFAFVPVVYSEFWQSPRDTAAMQQAITEMKTEITTLKVALENTNAETLPVLVDIRDALTRSESEQGATYPTPRIKPPANPK